MAAALLVLMALAGASIAGALLDDGDVPLPLDISIEPPADLPAFVRGAYDAMPGLGPVTIAVATDGRPSHRVSVDGSGATRIDTLKIGGGEVEGYTIYAGTRIGQLLLVDGRPSWYEQAGAIMEDPRVFVYATLGAARSDQSPGCEVAVSPGEQYAGTPARGWRHVGVEIVAGRPAHHVACGTDELWIDAETNLALRSRGRARDERGQPVPGVTRTVEVTSIEEGYPPAELFALEPPVGATLLDETAYNCAQDPYCGMPSAPVVTPPPAREAPGRPEDLEALVAVAAAAPQALGAFQVDVESQYAGAPQSSVTHRVLSNGAGSYRREQAFTSHPESVGVMLVRPDGGYTLEQTTDGVPYWQRIPESRDPSRGSAYPLILPQECPDGWRWAGVDLVLDQPADRLECGSADLTDAYWVDRATRLVVRTQVSNGSSGVDVEQVVDLRFEAPPADSFELPAGAEVRETE
ncbi:MAG: hypothetical protein A2V85_07705 [Chloroflexi bacterium RBG_16_72_14]|nr:MAG: hypothetical protein A2V85_07705 [Chloroflexi bacterium RBG_16_72_14]